MTTELLSEKLLKARCRLIIKEPWYGTMASYFTWQESKKCPTMGVLLKSDGTVTCYYNPEFCEKLTIDQLGAVVKHEIEHIVLLHCVRIGSRKHKLWNIATDMVINGKQLNPRIEHIDTLPITPYYFPADWDLKLISEEIYEKLESEKKYENDPGQTIDDHGTWEDVEVSEDEARQIVKDLTDQVASSVKAGSVPGHLVESIKKLNEPVRNWKHDLKQFFGRKFGGKRITYSRRNRRRQQFGLPGKSSHNSIPITICVDTSGSVDDVRLEQFISEIESISQKFRITLVQFDYAVQSVETYHRGDYNRLEIKGRGGTSFLNLFDAIEEKSLIGKLVMVCTDGEAQYPGPKEYSVMWVIFPHTTIESAPKPPFGDVIYITK